MAISVQTITTDEHRAYLDSIASASFLQTPAWATVKSDWRGESIGWFDDGSQIGAGLVLYKQIPKLKRYFAYLPEGPVIDWERPDLPALLVPLREHLMASGAFGARIGPTLVRRRWRADTIKAAIADPRLTRLSQARPDEVNPATTAAERHLRTLGWRPPKGAADGGFVTGQPVFNFWLPLAGRSPDELLAGMNQLWRRNIKKADKAGVEVGQGTVDDLPAFHELYVETTIRDHFVARSLDYFQTMMTALNAEKPDRVRLYLGRHDGDLVAATIWVRVGEHAWYSYGASSATKREVRGSNAVQWRMITDALAEGATVYDLRGVTEGIAEGDPELGLIQFKVGTGGEIVEYLGEWSLPINRLLSAAFDAYLARKG